MGDSLKITHREYVNPVDLYNSSIGFTVTNPGLETNPGYSTVFPYKYSINPGDGAIFPWLSGIAARFEKYQFSEITIHYRPSCPTTTPGGLALVANYDPADTVPTSRSELFNLESVVRAAVYDEMELKLKKPSMTGWRYIRTTSPYAVDPFELRTMDIGYWCSVLTNTTADIQFGDLYISYTVQLKGPKLSGSTAKSAHHHFYVDTVDRASFAGNATVNVPFTPVAAEGSNLLTYQPTTFKNALTLKGTNTALPEEHFEHHTNTLKTTWFTDGDVGWAYNGDSTRGMTQMRFDEPFSGIVSIQTNVVDGTGGGAIPRLNTATRPAGMDALKPLAAARLIQGPSSTDTRLATYAVKANAGDWLDWFFSASGNAVQWAGDIAATFSEVAPDLIAAGEILGISL